MTIKVIRTALLGGEIMFGDGAWANFSPTLQWLLGCDPFRGSHRRSYTLADAEAIVEWLREREAGYPPHEALMAASQVKP